MMSADVKWFLVAATLSIIVFFLSLSGYLTRDEQKEIETLENRLSELSAEYQKVAVERDRLNAQVEELTRINNRLREQADFIQTQAAYVKPGSPKIERDQYDVMVENAMLIHQRYITQVSLMEPPKRILYGRESMVAEGIITNQKWNDAMAALKASGAVVKGEGNNARLQWTSETANGIHATLMAWAVKQRR